jgi:predicted RNA-binding Zn ribbon-like protein
VSTAPRPPPFLIADHAALDFLNTVATPTTVPIEWLANGEDLLDWLRRVGAIDEAVAARFGPLDEKVDAVAEEARTLREWFRAFVKQHAGKELKASAMRELEPLNRLLAEDDLYRQVIAVGKKATRGQGPMPHPLRWNEQRRWSSPRQLLQPIAYAMGDLVCHADFTLVRACEGAGCTLMFYDRTKGHGRRWCSMSACGNRAKAAAHRARLREAKPGQLNR